MTFAGWRERTMVVKGNKSVYFPAFSASWKLTVKIMFKSFFGENCFA